MVPRLSIIIVNWHSNCHLASCLKSINLQTRSELFEVIVVDNASFDGCAEMLASGYPDVHFIQSTENLGFARANNLGAKVARGEVLLFLNPDTVIHDRAIEKMLEITLGHPYAGAVGARLLNPDGTIQTSCVQAFPTVLNQFLDADALRSLAPNSRLWGIRALRVFGQMPVPVEAVSGACLMLRRDVFENVGGFPTQYFMYGEDLDLCFRLVQMGRINLHCPHAVVTHFGGGSSRNCATGFAAVMIRESVMRFLVEHHGRWSARFYRFLMGCSALFRLALLVMAKKFTGRAHEYDASVSKWKSIWHWCWQRREALAKLGVV